MWDFPDPHSAPEDDDVVAVGADLEIQTLIQAYSMGIFPMHFATGELAWWSPNPRGILPLDALKVSQSLRKSMRSFRVTFNQDFHGVITGCADPTRDSGWITPEIIAAYSELHRVGVAHSVEVWKGKELVGGLYGVEIGGLFAGESMFHRERDASKVALVALVQRLRACGGNRLIDVQWRTEHLGSLGVIEVPRIGYLQMLSDVLETPGCLGAAEVS
jgi:leucyl/phenylalanyl-tRNA---protein transferase